MLRGAPTGKTAGSQMENRDLKTIEKLIGYRFQNRGTLEEALRHSSFANESADPSLRDNERLEFLGDAVLGLVIGHLLMQRFPGLREGDLSRMRANLVNESRLARVARAIDLGGFLQLGKGELQTGGRNKDSILAGSYEALTAAVYLDGGFEKSVGFVRRHFLALIDNLEQAANQLDYKSKLQEAVQTRPGNMPEYSVVREEGPDHDKTFWVSLTVADIESMGSGKSKKAAEQAAARAMLEIIEQNSSL
jgi:ribonuclease III